MRYLAILGLLFATLPACARDTPPLLTQLTQAMSTLTFLPVAVQTHAPTHLKFVYLPNGALARWNPKNDTFELSKTYWKKSPYARCVLPLFVHESIHAHLVKQARAQNFAWPVTLEDEVPAFYYQLKAEETIPNYAQACAPWYATLTAERASFAIQNWSKFQTAVYVRYSRFNHPQLPPPPLAQPWINNAQTGNTLQFFEHTYKLRHRTLSADNLWQKGGSWLHLRPTELSNITQDPRYLLYQQMLATVLPK